MSQPRIKPDERVSNNAVNAAGDLLSGRGSAYKMTRDDVLAVISNWRSAHGYPLNALAVTLRDRARRIDPAAIVGQRLKRLTSIEAKLRRFDTMRLSTMQDIGGCRAVVSTVGQVEKLKQAYRDADAKSPNIGARFVKVYDYIESPKSDGYRGIHLVYRYRSRAAHNTEWNGLRIEIQLRSKLQHAWATAVETVSTFTGQQLKSNIGSDDWKRFFALMGTAIAMKEGRAVVSDTPSRRIDLVNEIRALNEELHIDSVLSGWQHAAHTLTGQTYRGADLFLLVLDSDRQQLSIRAYRASEQARASADYLAVEKQAEQDPYINAVLASAESIAALQVAFPNYYLDTAAFRQVVAEVLTRWRDPLDPAQLSLFED